MSNSLSASFRTLWAREMQEKFWVTNVWRPQANFRLESELKNGDRIKRISRSAMVPQTYTRYSDVTPGDISTSAEELVVDTTPTIPFVISDLDELQSSPKARSGFTNDAVEQMNNIINGYYTAQVTNATSTIDASDFGGTSGQGASITPANIQKMFALAQKKVGRMNVFKYGAGESPFFANLTPDVYQALLEYLAGKESVLGDRTGTNGHAGQYMGFDLYVHNGGYWTGSVTIATNPTTGDKLIIKVADQTITITFKDDLSTGPTVAGEVHIASDVDKTRANLKTFLNAPGTDIAQATDAGATALSAEHQAALYGSTWTNTDATDLLTVTWRGVGAPVLSETFTSANNFVTPGTNISHNLFGKKGAIDMVIARQPQIQVDNLEKRIEEVIIKPYTLFGLKTFADGAKKLVDVKVDTSSYV